MMQILNGRYYTIKDSYIQIEVNCFYKKNQSTFFPLELIKTFSVLFVLKIDTLSIM